MIGLPQNLAIASRLYFFRRLRRLVCYLSLAAFLIFSGTASAGVGGSISGTITDSTGAVVTKATVTATNAETGIQQTTVTDTRGFYSIPALPIGRYDLTVAVTSFRPYQRTGVVIDANSTLTVNVVLQLVASAPMPSPSWKTSSKLKPSSTQNGEVITGAQMTAVPLNGRSFTDLLSSSARRRPTHLYHLGHRARRRRFGAFALRQPQPRHHLHQRPARICH